MGRPKKAGRVKQQRNNRHPRGKKPLTLLSEESMEISSRKWKLTMYLHHRYYINISEVL